MLGLRRLEVVIMVVVALAVEEGEREGWGREEERRQR